MDLSWDAYAPNRADRDDITVAPLSASRDQLTGLADALIVTADLDVVRDEGEPFARRLVEAGVRVTAVRFLGTIHDFLILNAMADTSAARGALAPTTARLRDALE
jgi:acetyl esterase